MNPYVHYFAQQSDSGELEGFHGARIYNKGGGLGNIFSKIFRKKIRSCCKKRFEKIHGTLDKRRCGRCTAGV